jgi:hypothetical protein
MQKLVSSRVQSVGEQIGDLMDEILTFFKPGAKITVLVRAPDYSDGSRDMLLTNDALDKVIAAIEFRKSGGTSLESAV